MLCRQSRHGISKSLNGTDMHLLPDRKAQWHFGHFVSAGLLPNNRAALSGFRNVAPAVLRGSGPADVRSGDALPDDLPQVHDQTPLGLYQAMAAESLAFMTLLRIAMLHLWTTCCARA